MKKARRRSAEPRSLPSRLLRRDRQGMVRRGGAELRQELLFLGLRDLEVAVLDMTETTDLLWNRRETDSHRMVRRGQARHDLVDPAPELADQPALHPPLVGIAEDVERRAPEHPERRQNP